MAEPEGPGDATAGAEVLDVTRGPSPSVTMTDGFGGDDPPPKVVGDPLIGRKLGDFIVRERIAEGGYGAVYRASQPMLGREAVVKVLRSVLRHNEQAIQRFLREARLASRLDHPYAAHVYAFGTEPDGLLWIAMELVVGTGLDARLRERGPLALPAAIPFLECLCEVVSTAHERGIIHRDIKPSNVMVLSRAGRLLPKLLDLGIAKPVARREIIEPAVPRSDAEVELTSRDAALGSPAYMAPEQWHGQDATERTDVYALGVLAYEVLTGRRPFTGASAVELMQAHLEATPPSLGDGFPAALGEVIARALAKAPADRHASTLELAAALRAAAGLVPDAIPQLPSRLRDEWIRRAPQPLAEAVAALDAVRSVREGRDALADLERTFVHYLGVIVLAWRASRGRTGVADRALVQELRKRRLDDDDWWSVCASLADDEFPLPELARFCSGKDNPFAALRGELGAAVEQAAVLLDELAFVLDYPLVVTRDERLELWTGVRRPRRASLARSIGLPPNTPCLVTAEGRLLLSLAPLVEVASPTPGAADELFLVDGRGTRDATRLVALPAGFECNRDGVWTWLAHRVLDESATSSEPPVEETSPYPGLSAFASTDAARFFGRERETDAFLNRLRVQSLIAVVGASGSGKSSFVQAGVVPNLPDGWRAITIRPGAEPIAALDAMVRRLGGEIELERELADDPDALGRALRGLGEGSCIVVVVDQFEELFTLCPDAAQRARFTDALVFAARSAEDPVRVVLTLRDDFLVRAEQLASLRERLTWGLQVLTTPMPADLIRILVEPARRAGYAFESDALPAEMVDAVAGKPGALALLAFTVAALWAERDPTTRQLTVAAYAAIGGVGGALARHAEGVLEAMPAEERELVREAFRHLVTADETRAVVSRPDLTTMLASPRAERVLETLIDARLLVASEGPDAIDRVEIVHEALIEAWPRLRDWVREDKAEARLRDQLRVAARQWHERDRPTGLLWRGDVLAELQRWRAQRAGRLSEREEAFARASLSEAARGRRVRRISIASVVAILSIAVVVLFRLRSTADQLATKSQRDLIDQLEARGREALFEGDVVLAAEQLVKAYDAGLRGRGLALMLHRATASREAQLQVLEVGAPVRYTELSPDGTQLLTVRDGDGRVGVWDLASGTELQHANGIAPRWAQFDDDGRRVVVAGSVPKIWEPTSGRAIELPRSASEIRFGPDGTVITQSETEVAIWDVASGGEVRRLPIAVPIIARLDVSARHLAVSDGRAITLWDPGGALLHTFEGHGDEILRVSFSRDGELLLSASADGSARLWDVDARAPLAVFSHGGRIVNALVDASRSYVVTTSETGAARVWSLDGTMLSAFGDRRAKLTATSLDAEGRRAVMADAAGSACVYAIPSGALVQCFQGHGKAITAVHFGPDGRTIVTASLDGTVRVWNAEARAYASALELPARADRLAVTPDGATLVTSDHTGTIRGWERATGRERWRVAGDGGDVSSLAIEGAHVLYTTTRGAYLVDAATGSAVASAAGAYEDAKLTSQAIVLSTTTGVIEVRSRNGALVRAIDTGAGVVAQLALSRDGRTILSANGDGTVGVFDATTGQRELALAGHVGPVLDVVFSPDERAIVSTATDKTLRVWDRTGQPRHVLKNGELLRTPRFDRRGRLLTASADSDRIYLWDLEGGRLLAHLQGHTPGSPSYALAIAPGGELAISGSQDGSAIVWDLERLGAVARLASHSHPVVSAMFTPDEAFVVTASWDSTIKIWEVRAAALEVEVGRARRLSE
ncbi:MAG: protein kinase [Deltaproteobacteria bacterium]|nr:protein kinase [Kofleriaceae bacterium]